MVGQQFLFREIVDGRNQLSLRKVPTRPKDNHRARPGRFAERRAWYAGLIRKDIRICCQVFPHFTTTLTSSSRHFSAATFSKTKPVRLLFEAERGLPRGPCQGARVMRAGRAPPAPENRRAPEQPSPRRTYTSAAAQERPPHRRT